MNPSFHRLQLLTGTTALERLQQTSVILFGIGGVGSWCAEALIRSGIGHLTIVDSDVVCVTNVNRQVQAMPASVGKVKTHELARRLSEINPAADINVIHGIYNRTTAEEFNLAEYHYVIDAIDSLSSKVELIMRAAQSGAKVYTALGASNKLDPTQIKVSSLWKSRECPLGKLVRKRLRRRGFHGEATCVYSEELQPVQAVPSTCGTSECMCPKIAKNDTNETADSHEWCSSKKQINGSAVHVTGTFGFILAGLVVQDVIKQAGNASSQ
jgi:tRNA A37 threonylcarbamoyladenosine dehydratase